MTAAGGGSGATSLQAVSISRLHRKKQMVIKTQSDCGWTWLPERVV